MPTSPEEKFRQLDVLLDAALDLPTGERDAFVDRATHGDEELRREIRLRLQAHESSGEFLERPAVELAAPLLHAAAEIASISSIDTAPERVGPYRVVREIGHGGMGIVYLAERDDGQFQQRVALKVVRNASAHQSVLVARFLEERRILAVLEHPGIARLLDGGVTDAGAPWFAMEYVEGEALDRYCDAHSLSVERRLALFGNVCEAVQYAHQHLVVHRDLKPSNIFVTNDGIVKLLDFGIAKLLDPLELATIDAPRTEWQAMTPEYAAPEQIRGNPVSTATDVYALGVVLYALVAGRRPYELRGLSPAEVQRTVCEVDPPKPSATLSADSSAPDDRVARARARDATPDELRRRLHGDLDAIAMQALRKEPSRRYASAAALLDDLHRLRTQRPVLARPDSARYRVGKFAARHRLALAIAAALVLLAAGGFERERVLRSRAQTELRKAKAVEAYVIGIFDGSDPFSQTTENGHELSTRALLDRGAKRVDVELAAQPEVEAEMRGVLSRVYTNLGVFEPAEAQARGALTRRTALYGPNDPQVAEAEDQLGFVLLKRDSMASAERLLQHAFATRKAVLGTTDSATVESLYHLSELYRGTNDFDRALGYSRDALEASRRTFGENDPRFAQSLVEVALLLWQKGNYEEAEPMLRRALAIQVSRLGENAAATAQTMHNLAQVLEMRSQYAQAEIYYRRALAAKRVTLGNAHPSVTVNLNNLGIMLAKEMERPDEGEPLIREALALDRQIFGARHEYVAASLDNYAAVLVMKGDFKEAESAAREALAMNRSLLGEENTGVALDMNLLGTILLLKGDLDGAIPLFRESRTQFARFLGATHLSTMKISNNLARALCERGSTKEADEIFREVAAHTDSSQSRERAVYIGARVGLGRALLAEGRRAEARDVLTPAVSMAITQWKIGNWRIADAQLALGETLASIGSAADAKPLLEAARATLDQQRRAQPRLAAEADAALARLARPPAGR